MDDLLPVIPLPLEASRQPGTFIFDRQTVIFADESNRANAAYLRDLLAPPTGFPLPVEPDQGGDRPGITLKITGERAALGAEGYRLAIAPGRVTITAPEPAGGFYGLQTLRQLLPPEGESRRIVTGVQWEIPCLEISDRPRFPWRGYMLDEGRHFQGKAAVLQALDLMALQKLNTLHWHLTEDQGWRVEIRRYPRLTGVGSRRAGTSKGFYGRHNGIPHEGHYTQAEIREVVAYAAQRHIRVVPEIEMPGHSLAALAAYPELSCSGGPFEVATHFGIYPELYCAGKEATFSFLQDVLDEILELFPSPEIHIGGDEAPLRRWKSCPACRERIRQEGLQDARQLKGYFTNRIAAYLAARGRRAIGWNEVLQPGLVPEVDIHYWAGNRRRLAEAARTNGRRVVVSPFLETYLDHSHALTPLSRAYRFEPVLPEFSPAGADLILGLEAAMWGEFLPNRARLDYQTYPRLPAYAETGWTAGENKNYASFRQRLPGFLRRLDFYGVGYAPLEIAEPGWLSRLTGIFTILQPQTGVRGENSSFSWSGSEPGG